MSNTHKLMVAKALELVAHIESARGRAREIRVEDGTLRRWEDLIEAGGDFPPLRGKPLEALRAFLARHGALQGLGVPLTYADGLEEGRERTRREVGEAVGVFVADVRRRLGLDEGEFDRALRAAHNVARPKGDTGEETA